MLVSLINYYITEIPPHVLKLINEFFKVILALADKIFIISEGSGFLESFNFMNAFNLANFSSLLQIFKMTNFFVDFGRHNLKKGEHLVFISYERTSTNRRQGASVLGKSNVLLVVRPLLILEEPSILSLTCFFL